MVTLSVERLNCNFEEDRCNWSQVETMNLLGTEVEDQVDWTVNQGETRTENTGPSVDHTKKTGKDEQQSIC